MDIATMRTFLSVARNRSISKAARELFATQPTISLRIKRLEAELGFEVLSRSWRGVELTPQGQHILPTIADHLIRLQTATTMAQPDVDHSGMSSILSAHAAPISVGVDEWLVGEGISGLVAALSEVEEIHLTATHSSRLHAMVAHGVCTRGVTYSTPTPKAWAAEETTLWHETLAVVYPKADRLTPPHGVDSLRDFFRTRRFILMDDPIFSDHAGVTAPLLEAMTPAATTVVDNTSIMAALCTTPGHATIVPSGLCSRKPAFAQPGLDWSVLDESWGRLSVVKIENEPAEGPAEEAIDRAILRWAGRRASG